MYRIRVFSLINMYMLAELWSCKFRVLSPIPCLSFQDLPRNYFLFLEGCVCVCCCCCSVTKSCPSPWDTQELKYARFPCPSLSPRICSNSCPLSQWCRPAVSSSVIPFFCCPQSFPPSRSFPKRLGHLALCIKWPKYWNLSFSIILFNEYSGLICVWWMYVCVCVCVCVCVILCYLCYVFLKCFFIGVLKLKLL